MILRRFMEHVSDQNWFAVVLDFLIVVLGVTVGLQLTERYDESQRRAAEEQYLDGIANDYGIYEDLIQCRLDHEKRVADALARLIRQLDGEPVDADAHADIAYALTSSHTAQPAFELEGNTSALVAGDLVRTISDEGLRGWILAAQSISTVTVTSMAQLQDNYLSIDRFDAYLVQEEEPQFGFFVVTDYDLAGMQADPAMRSRLINLVNLHRATFQIDSRLQYSVQNVLNHLEGMGVAGIDPDPAACPYPAAG